MFCVFVYARIAVDARKKTNQATQTTEYAKFILVVMDRLPFLNEFHHVLELLHPSIVTVRTRSNYKAVVKFSKCM